MSKRWSGLFLALGIACIQVQARAQTTQPASPATTSIGFEQSVLDDLGIEVQATGTAEPQRAGLLGFAAVHPETLAFTAPGGDFEGFTAGRLQHSGELILRIRGRALVLSGFVLHIADDPLELDLVDGTGRRRLRLEAPQPLVRDGMLHLQNVDLTIAPELAEELGRPELEGAYIGWAHVRLPVGAGVSKPQGSLSGGPDPCERVFSADRDVMLIDLGTVSQLAREPGGRVAVTLSALVRNVGTSAILWYEDIEPDAAPENIGEHPYLVLNMYRILNGRIKQIGRSDVKHAFFSGNTACPCAGGHVIYPTCEDNYGAVTNADRMHLGPREELNPSTGDWVALGSHFDALPMDAFRDHGGDGDHDSYAHRLTVQEADLQTGGEFYVEGWYIAHGDVALLNSMGHYAIEPSLGATWSFGPSAPLINGSILDRFADPQALPSGADSRLFDTGEGRFQLALRTTDLGGGDYHYEYALMNFDFDRRIRAVEIELAAGTSVSNVEFVDADGDAGNDWTSNAGATALVWTAPPGNELDWGTLYSFAYDADVEPDQVSVTLFPAEAGTADRYTLSLIEDGNADSPDTGDESESDGSALWAPIALCGILIAVVLGCRRRLSGVARK